VLHRKNLSPIRVVDARKEAMAEDDAWSLFVGVKEIVVAKGKTFVMLDPHQNSKNEILKQTLGRSGTLRAPALLLGDRLLVGYSDGLYTQFLG
jgi:arsenate reductase-like glutaredoxin family protein